MADAPYTTIIGLEVHVQLATKSKLFCRCSTQFGAEPNTQTCPLCLGMPGTLPVMNEEAYRLSLMTAIAINCEIPKFCKWDRKQYYYPDLPKGYQISQFDLPMSQNGFVAIEDLKDRFEPKKVRLIRAHLEEDAGKSVHDEVSGKADSQIDLNRTGTPLLEIVSEPDLRSSLEARVFLNELKLLLTYIQVSDCNMQEGSLRCDANINLHVEQGGEKIATPIVEIKNLNSFRAVERALVYEEARQWQEWQETGKRLGEVPKQTRGWDDTAGVTRGQRSKEESSDYRYLPDPDLVPVCVTDAQLEEAKNALGELPAALRKRLHTEFSLSAYDADVIINQGRGVVTYFIEVANACGDSKLAANWVSQDVLRVLKEQEQSIDAFEISSGDLSDLIKAIKSGELPNARARDVFGVMLKDNCDVKSAMSALGIEQVDESELVSLCEELLAANPRVVDDVKSGNDKAVGALIGQAKKKNPNIDPGKVRQICLEIIAKS